MTPPKLAIRYSLLVLPLVAAAMLMVAPSAVVAGQKEMSALVAKKAAIINGMHRKAGKELLNAAQDKSFTEYFKAGDDAGRKRAKSKIEQVALVVQSRFHVAELCLIDPNGVEIARIVADKIAPDSELSPDEKEAVFFESGFSQMPKSVAVSVPYVSPDAAKWVVAYTTPVVVDNEKKAILHYEHGLDVFQAALNKDLSGDATFLLAISEDGFVVSDSRKDLKIAQVGEKEALGDYFEPLSEALRASLAGGGGEKMGATDVEIDGNTHAIAYARIDGGWTLLAVEKL